MILAIDVGNTNIVVGCIDDRKTYFIERLSTNRTKTELEYAVDLKNVLDIYHIKKTEIEGCIISSVVPQITNIVKLAAEKILKKNAIVLGPGVKTGLNIMMDNPGQLGADQVADALILAKNPLSAAILSVQMKKRQILRTYLALVDGLLPDSGTINAPIARMEGSVITREVNFGTGESAITHYERLAAGKEYSLAELHLETGRTHQIRVHMKYIGHPLPGDYLYNPDYRRINRQPLHSYQLEFTHPITGKVMLFTAPLPIDFISAFYSNSLK